MSPLEERLSIAGEIRRIKWEDYEEVAAPPPQPQPPRGGGDAATSIALDATMSTVPAAQAQAQACGSEEAYAGLWHMDSASAAVLDGLYAEVNSNAVARAIVVQYIRCVW